MRISLKPSSSAACACESRDGLLPRAARPPPMVRGATERRRAAGGAAARAEVDVRMAVERIAVDAMRDERGRGALKRGGARGGGREADRVKKEKKLCEKEKQHQCAKKKKKNQSLSLAFDLFKLLETPPFPAPLSRLLAHSNNKKKTREIDPIRAPRFHLHSFLSLFSHFETLRSKTSGPPLDLAPTTPADLWNPKKR